MLHQHKQGSSGPAPAWASCLTVFLSRVPRSSPKVFLAGPSDSICVVNLTPIPTAIPDSTSILRHLSGLTMSFKLQRHFGTSFPPPPLESPSLFLVPKLWIPLRPQQQQKTLIPDSARSPRGTRLPLFCCLNVSDCVDVEAAWLAWMTGEHLGFQEAVWEEMWRETETESELSALISQTPTLALTPALPWSLSRLDQVLPVASFSSLI